MAYRSVGRTNDDFVRDLEENGQIKSPEVGTAMRAVDRRDFCLPAEAYRDFPVRIGFGATISAPHMHAFALEHLKDHLKPGAHILDVGSGSGYLTTCFALMAGEDSKVIGLDHIPELVEQAIQNVSKSHKHLLEESRIEIFTRDGRLGYQEGGPYQAIHFGAAAPEIPKALLDQLSPGGRLLIPVGKSQETQRMMIVDKDADGELHHSEFMSVRYVPLTSVEEQMVGSVHNIDPLSWGSGCFDMLNDDILLTIFDCLNLNQWMIAELVCVRWHDLLLLRCWKRLKTANLASLMGLRSFCPLDVHPSTFHESTVRLHRIVAMAAKCAGNLRVLRTGFSMEHSGMSAHLRIPLEVFCAMATGFSQLRSMDLTMGQITLDPEIEPQQNMQYLHNLYFSKNLTELKLDAVFDEAASYYYEGDLADQIVHKIVCAAPGLRKLSLMHNHLLNGACLLAANLHNLIELNLAFCRRMKAETLSMAFQQLPLLHTISLYSNNKLLGNCLQYITPGIVEVDISFCDDLTPDTVMDMLKSHQQLEVLQMSHLTQLTNEVLQNLLCLPALRSLTLGHYYPFAYYSYASFSVHQHDISQGIKSLGTLASLRCLDLSKNEFVSDEILTHLCQRCSSLENLDLSHIPELTELGFEHLCALPNLHTLNVSCNGSFSPDMLLKIAQNTQLAFVTMRGCEQITHTAVKGLHELWPKHLNTIFQIF